MQRLILLRHGKAERANVGGDFERGLTERGRSDAALMGRVLAQAGLVPDLALVSAAKRTRQTWQATGAVFPQAVAEIQPRLYGASGEQIAQAVEDAADQASTVIVVGHNPGLHSFALQLLGHGGAGDRARLAAGFPTATAAAFTFDAQGRASYDGVFYAKDYGGGGGE